MDTHDKNAESEYRSMLWTVARTRSSAALDFTGLQRVRAHLAALARARGIRAKPAKTHHAGRPTNMNDPDRGPSLRKIEAILADAGRPWAYVTRGANGKPSMLQQICGVDRIEFADVDRLHRLVAALMKDQARRSARP